MDKIFNSILGKIVQSVMVLLLAEVSLHDLNSSLHLLFRNQ